MATKDNKEFSFIKLNNKNHISNNSTLNSKNSTSKKKKIKK